MLIAKEIPLCSGRNRGIIKYQFFLTIQGPMEKLQAHEKRVNEIQEDMGAQALFSKFLTK